MASISDLVRVVAEVARLDENFVSVYARSAREAGLITHRGRGRSAASMGAADGANLLTALNAGSLAKDAPAVIRGYRALQLRWLEPAGMQRSARLLRSPLRNVVSTEITFCAALDALIQAFTPGTDGSREAEGMFVDGTDYPQGGAAREELIRDVFVENRLEVHFERPRKSATISFRMGAREGTREALPIFLARYEDRNEANLRDEAFGDRVQRTSISALTLDAVGKLLAT